MPDGRFRGQRQAFVLTTNDITDVGNGVSNRQRASVNHDNHSRITKEVINDNDEHPGFPVITGRL